MNTLYGAIAGDITGSSYEFNKKYKFLSDDKRNILYHISNNQSRFTDDTVMTIAVMDALNKCNHSCSDEFYKKAFIKSMQCIGRKYIDCGFGGMFYDWILNDNPEPYNSYGNGAAMRISPIGWYAESPEEAEHIAKLCTEISHNSDIAIKGAQTIAGIIYMSKTGCTKEDIKTYTKSKGYHINKSVSAITNYNQNNISCDIAVEESIICFLNSTDIYDAVEKAISIGGDSDTIGAITGSIADAFYGGIHSIDLMNLISCKLDRYLKDIISEFATKIGG